MLFIEETLTMNGKYREVIDESVNSMKKVLKALLVLCAISCAIPAFAACSQDLKQVTTGSACSISELNNLEKSEKTQENVQKQLIQSPKRERNLRPLRYTSEIRKSDDKDCLFRMCLYKTLLGK